MNTPPLLFDNLPERISPERVAEITGYARNTVYQWKYRPQKYDTPIGLFVQRKPGAKLMVRTDVLKKWLNS